jgi:hypothetical protein
MRLRRSVIVAYVAACAVLLLGAAGLRIAIDRLNVFVVKRPVELRAPLDTIPPVLGRWQRVGEDVRFGAALVEELGTSQYLDRLYAIGGDPAKGLVNLHLAYYTGVIDDVPHIPERCWDAAGMQMTRPPERIRLEIDDRLWEPEPELVNRATGQIYRSVEVRHPVTGFRERVFMPIGEAEMTVTEFQHPLRRDRRQMGGYFFLANGRWTPSALGVRSLAFSLTDKYAYYCKVQVTIPDLVADDPEALDRFRAYASELVSEVLPHLMKRLPQWPEYEARQARPSSPSPTG